MGLKIKVSSALNEPTGRSLFLIASTEQFCHDLFELVSISSDIGITNKPQFAGEIIPKGRLCLSIQGATILRMPLPL